eukprot:CAMPEP_0114559844 /NCGR_PEP_ID=MMETSP0114-20121206/11137_1 /TAXON_ID=31324 /ORGANISM="Goniomonas sp, Strain m" /LENGTH=360 /DNA_ID=CAMNT_0001745339 /DNA_START=18 /DNA_END=1097 /DNA_ORIENTATION=-
MHYGGHPQVAPLQMPYYDPRAQCDPRGYDPRGYAPDPYAPDPYGQGMYGQPPPFDPRQNYDPRGPGPMRGFDVASYQVQYGQSGAAASFHEAEVMRAMERASLHKSSSQVTFADQPPLSPSYGPVAHSPRYPTSPHYPAATPSYPPALSPRYPTAALSPRHVAYTPHTPPPPLLGAPPPPAVGAVGIYLNKRTHHIIDLIPLMPAERCGKVSVGDCLTQIDHKDIEHMSGEQVQGLLFGDVGTTVTLRFRKGEDNQLYDVILPREAEPVAPHTMLSKDAWMNWAPGGAGAQQVIVTYVLKAPGAPDEPAAPKTPGRQTPGRHTPGRVSPGRPPSALKETSAYDNPGNQGNKPAGHPLLVS